MKILNALLLNYQEAYDRVKSCIEKLAENKRLLHFQRINRIIARRNPFITNNLKKEKLHKDALESRESEWIKNHTIKIEYSRSSIEVFRDY